MIDLNVTLDKWKKRLGLSDWDISIDWRDAMDMQQKAAKTFINPSGQSAEIRILAMGDRQDCEKAEQDPELDIVHELVHVRLWAIDPQDPGDTLHICREQSIEWIARALIESDRVKL